MVQRWMGAHRPPRRTGAGRILYAAFALAATGGATVEAATLQISPVTIEMAPGEMGAAFTLSNAGARPVYGQLRVFEWDQENGNDVLHPTSTLAASPPLLQIQPGSQQLVRVVRSRSAPQPAELSYRILIDEIPDDTAEANSGVQIRMRYSVPVFVDNDIQGRRTPELDWALLHEEGQWKLRVTNSGNIRARLNTVTVVDAEGRRHRVEHGLLGYALAGRSREWPIDLSSHAKLGNQAKVEATVNAEPVRVHAQVLRQGIAPPGGAR